LCINLEIKTTKLSSDGNKALFLERKCVLLLEQGPLKYMKDERKHSSCLVLEQMLVRLYESGH